MATRSPAYVTAGSRFRLRFHAKIEGELSEENLLQPLPATQLPMAESPMEMATSVMSVTKPKAASGALSVVGAKRSALTE